MYIEEAVTCCSVTTMVSDPMVIPTLAGLNIVTSLAMVSLMAGLGLSMARGPQPKDKQRKPPPPNPAEHSVRTYSVTSHVLPAS